jgi:polynucleotide 5'-hydroxyl-kinase GRC3/NOL9
MAEKQLDIPPALEQIELAGLRGTLIVIGALNVGKSTFAQYLYRTLCAGSRCVAYLDGDPGQSILGPPSTMTLAVGQKGDNTFPPRGPTWRSFVGAVSPRGHMLPVLVGAARLAQAAQEAGAEVIIYDTSGLVDAAQGGAALKLAKIDLLRPSAVFAIRRDQELEPLLAPLRRGHRMRVVDLRLSAAIRPRDSHARQAYRASQFGRYFTTLYSLTVNWKQMAVVPPPKFIYSRLAAFEDENGFTLGLGVIQVVDFRTRQVTLSTPLQSLDRVDMLRLGDLTLDLQIFRDQPLT